MNGRTLFCRKWNCWMCTHDFVCAVCATGNTRRGPEGEKEKSEDVCVCKSVFANLQWPLATSRSRLESLLDEKIYLERHELAVMICVAQISVFSFNILLNIGLIRRVPIHCTGWNGELGKSFCHCMQLNGFFYWHSVRRAVLTVSIALQFLAKRSHLRFHKCLGWNAKGYEFLIITLMVSGFRVRNVKWPGE